MLKFSKKLHWHANCTADLKLVLLLALMTVWFKYITQAT